MSNIYLKKGHLLIAEPSIIGDMSFNRSIIIIADHKPEDLKDSGICKEDEELSDYIGSDEEELDPVKDLGTVISDNCRISRSENRWTMVWALSWPPHCRWA